MQQSVTKYNKDGKITLPTTHTHTKKKKRQQTAAAAATTTKTDRFGGHRAHGVAQQDPLGGHRARDAAGFCPFLSFFLFRRRCGTSISNRVATRRGGGGSDNRRWYDVPDPLPPVVRCATRNKQAVALHNVRTYLHNRRTDDDTAAAITQQAT